MFDENNGIAVRNIAIAQLVLIVLFVAILFLACACASSAWASSSGTAAAAANLSTIASVDELQRCKNIVSVGSTRNPVFSAKVHDRSRVVILMATTLSSRAHAVITIAMNRTYANHHGYQFVLIDLDKRPDLVVAGRALQWTKIACINELLTSGKTPMSFDYIMWVDDDACFIDNRLSLDPILIMSDSADVIICRDMGPVSAINSGVFLVKNTMYAQRLMSSLIDAKETRFRKHDMKEYHEQTCLEMVVNEELPGVFDKVHKGNSVDVLYHGYPIRTAHFCILHEDVMNSMQSPFVVHMAGLPNAERTRRLQAVAAEYKKTGKALGLRQLTADVHRRGSAEIFPWTDMIHAKHSFVVPHAEATIVSATKTRIPKCIHQTFETYVAPAFLQYSIATWIDLNPEYSYQYHTGFACRQFLASSVTSGALSQRVLDAYDALYPNAFKADLWRMCYIYLHGGVYVDIKLCCVCKLDSFMDAANDDFVFVIDRMDKPRAIVYNAFFAAAAKHPIVKLIIEQTVRNIEKQDYGQGCLDITGPVAVGKAVHDFFGFPHFGHVIQPGVYQAHELTTASTSSSSAATVVDSQMVASAGRIRVLKHVSGERIVNQAEEVVIRTRSPYPPMGVERNLFERITGKAHYGALYDRRQVFVAKDDSKR